MSYTLMRTESTYNKPRSPLAREACETSAVYSLGAACRAIPAGLPVPWL